MQKKLGHALQTMGGLLTLLLAGASDMGHISAGVLALGLLAAALLVCAGQRVLRHRRTRHPMRLPLRSALPRTAPRRRMAGDPGRV